VILVFYLYFCEKILYKMMEIDKYEFLNGFATPAYLYIEDEGVEKYWLDSQSLYYYVNDLIDEDTNLINGKNWNIIEPLKIKGVKVTKENSKDVIKYFVTECSNESDYNKEWNFKEHKVIND